MEASVVVPTEAEGSVVPTKGNLWLRVFFFFCCSWCFEYVNFYRIHEFIRLAQSPLAAQKTLLGLAQEAGFNSKSTFNKSFKELMGCSPSDYLKSRGK